MANFLSLGELQTLKNQNNYRMPSRSVHMYDGYNYDYAALYRMQPNVRTCVDFLARNIAQLGLHLFRRDGNNGRERVYDHPLINLINKPLPVSAKTTRYRLIESLVSDLGIYFNAFWLKLRLEDQVEGLFRLPPHNVQIIGGMMAKEYKFNIGSKQWTFSPDDVVHFRGYNPEDAIMGLSPLETLRRILAEEHESGKYREGFWKRGARIGGVIQRPESAPEWGEEARERFAEEFEQVYSGYFGSGKTAILEEGMTWVDTAFNPRESEYLGGRKLTREECARAYHIPLPMVGILDNATFSNIREQHKQLYQDSLGPTLVMIAEDIQLQLLTEWEDSGSYYLEFNILEKLKGDFEEQVSALQSAVGRPWMSANEARTRLNMPLMEQEDANELVVPLNVLIGGQASPRDAEPDSVGKGIGLSQKTILGQNRSLRERHEKQWAAALARHYRRQQAAIVSRVPKSLEKGDIGGIFYDTDRWNEELMTDLFKLNTLTATSWARIIDEETGAETSQDAMLPWLEEHSRIQSELINQSTASDLEQALTEEDPLEAVKNVFSIALSVKIFEQATTSVTTALNFGMNEAANAAGLRMKRWKVTSNDPRPEHQRLNGETVALKDRFSNGMKWPGDPRGGAENNANCRCTVEFFNE